MTIEDEMLRLPKLKHIGLALVQFVYSLEKGTFVKRTTDWVYQPNNFIAFGFLKKGEQIVMHISNDCDPPDFDEKDLAILPHYQGHWKPRCIIKQPRQLACAARYIEVLHRRHRPK